MRLLLLLFIFTIGTLGAEYDVILVRSDVYADWIIAQGYSQKSGVPIIATSPSTLDPPIEEQLRGYRAFGFDKVLIIGGEMAVSPAVQQEVEAMGYATHRISEADRSGTSARVALELFGESKTVIMANGAANEALLVAGRLASASGNPVLFVKGDEIPPSVSAVLKSIGVEKIILVDLELSGDLKSELATQYDLEVLRSAEGYKVEREPGALRALLLLVGGIAIGVIAVFFGGKLLEKGEKVPITVLTEDEKRVIRPIKDHGGEITQDQLPALTSFSRPKISRVISDLVERGVLSKEPQGRTQKIVLIKQLIEEEK